MPWDTIETKDTVDPFICEVCGSDECVPPSGDEDSPVLFIGEYPGNEEIAKGRLEQSSKMNCYMQVINSANIE